MGGGGGPQDIAKKFQKYNKLWLIYISMANEKLSTRRPVPVMTDGPTPLEQTGW